jgi:hypothetical protein
VVTFWAIWPGVAATDGSVEVGTAMPKRKSFQTAKDGTAPGRSPPLRLIVMARSCLPRSLVVSGPVGVSPARPSFTSI